MERADRYSPRFSRLYVLVAATLFFAAASLRAQHVHVQLGYSAAQKWRLYILDFESGEYDPVDGPFFSAHQAFNFVPANAFTNFLGPAGAGVWTMPETENPNLLFLGIGTSGIAAGTFANNQIHLLLRSLSGPGHFALYNVDPFGSPIVHMNSRDGIDAIADSLALNVVGGHTHVNRAFSAPGAYRIGFSASGRLTATGRTNASPIIEYTFIVQDIPWRPSLSVVRATEPARLLLTVHSEPGRACQIESTTDFQHWTVLTTFIAGATHTEVPLPVATVHHEYFRALTLPQ